MPLSCAIETHAGFVPACAALALKALTALMKSGASTKTVLKSCKLN